MDPGTLISLWRRNWAVIKGAPIIFSICVGIGVAFAAGLIWWVFDWRYSDRFETQEARLDLLQDELDRYQEGTGTASPNEAAEKVAQLEAELARLKAPYWLPLSALQIAGLKEGLGQIPERPVLILCGSPECRDLALGFQSTFTAAGWSNVTIEASASLDTLGIAGIRIESSDDDANALEGLIETTAALPVRTLVGPDLPSTRFVIVIGEKPMWSE